MVRRLFLSLIVFFQVSQVLAATNAECEKQANYAYSVVLLKEEGQSEDQIIEWVLEAAEEAVIQGVMSQKESDKASMTMLVALGLSGTSNQVAAFVFDRCIK